VGRCCARPAEGGVAVVSAAAGDGPAPGADRSTDSLAGPAEGLPVARVRIRPHPIFDPVPPGRLSGFYRLANRLHTRTRESAIRSHVLLAPGEPWQAARARETERNLRALEIFDEARVRGERDGDSVTVTVETHDAWTSNPEFNLERGGGRLFGSVQFSERNLLGRAQQLSIAYREDPAGNARSIAVADPGIGGTRLRFSASASDGSSGTNSEVSFGLPFYAEDTPLSSVVGALRAHSEARLYQQDAEVAHFARRNEQIELRVGHGRRLDHSIIRLTGSLLIWDRSFGSATLAPGAPAAFVAGEEQLRVRRLAVEARLWRPGFVERTVVDRLDGIEDIDLGRSITFTAGLSPHILGSTVTEGYGSVGGGVGADAGRVGFGWTRVSASTRFLDRPRETKLDFEARWVNQAIPRQTLVLAAVGGASWRPERDFQFVVGGLNGLRAHGVHALAGDQIWRLNAESRWLIGRNFYQLVSVGAAAFWDAARTWGTGSGDAPWQHDIGLGLRLSLPHSALNRVMRLDLAWRASPNPVSPRQAVFSFGSSQAF
jgi:hypothetical protein